MTRADYADFVAQLVLAGAEEAAVTRPRGKTKAAGRSRQAALS